MNSYPPRQGIGTEIIKYVKDLPDSYVTFSEDDGNKEDGSYLTGNGPAFVNYLKKKELSQIKNEFYDEEEYKADIYFRSIRNKIRTI